MINFRGHNDGLRLVPENILTEDKVGQVLRKTSGLQDLNLQRKHKPHVSSEEYDTIRAPGKKNAPKTNKQKRLISSQKNYVVYHADQFAILHFRLVVVVKIISSCNIVL